MLIRFGAQTWLPSPSAPGSAAPRSRIERNLLRWRDRGFGMAGSAALPPSHSWLRAVLPVVAVLYLGASMIFVLMLLDIDRKSTRLNSSHDQISYAVFCLKKKNGKWRLVFYPRLAFFLISRVQLILATLHT